MIKNTHNAVMELDMVKGQANEVYTKTVSHIKANYKEGSELYNTAMKTAQDALKTSVDNVRIKNREMYMKDFEDVRKAIRRAVSVAPSSEVVGMLPLISEGRFSKTELDGIIERYKGNYLDQKMIHKAMKIPFQSVEDIMDELESLEKPLNDYFNSGCGSYMDALMKNGEWIQRVDTLTDDFLNTYGQGVQ